MEGRVMTQMAVMQLIQCFWLRLYIISQTSCGLTSVETSLTVSKASGLVYDYNTPWHKYNWLAGHLQNVN